MTIKPIRTVHDLEATKARLAELMRRPNNGELDDEIEVLATLIGQFEEKYFPIDAPTPVMAIKFRMEEKGMTPRQLEPFIGSRARVSEVLSEKRQLSIDMIRSLHEGLGIPYEALISDRPRNGDKQTSAPAIERLNSLGFNLKPDRVPSFISSSFNVDITPTLFRKARTQRAASKTDQHALTLWEAAVLQKSESTPLPVMFKPSAFGANDLRKIAKLSTKPDGPRCAIRALNERGVAVVIMPSLPGTFLDGAAMANHAGTPVVGLTLRHDRVDSFWFTLLHELAHIVLHFNALLDTHDIFVDDMEIHSEDHCEREADELARDSLIPQSILQQIAWGPGTSLDDLVALATRARVHLSVVAGRWQRDHQNYKKFSRQIERHSIRSMLQHTARLI